MKQEAAPVAWDGVERRKEAQTPKFERTKRISMNTGRLYWAEDQRVPPKVERGEAVAWVLTAGGKRVVALLDKADAELRVRNLRESYPAEDYGIEPLCSALASPPVEQVPREPTKAMYEAGMLIDAMSPADPWEALKLIWQAMYDAAPVEGRNKGES